MRRLPVFLRTGRSHRPQFQCLLFHTSRKWHNEKQKNDEEGERTKLENEKTSIEQNYQRRMDEILERKSKARHIGLMGGFFGVLFGVQAYILWKRLYDYKKMNEKMPPISFDEFKEKYLLKGVVAGMAHTPEFNVIDVYFNNLTQQEINKKKIKQFFSLTSTGPERFAPQPDIRVRFNKPTTDLEKIVLEAQAAIEGESCIYIENVGYPTAKEVFAILGSSIIAVICVAVATS